MEREDALEQMMSTAISGMATMLLLEGQHTEDLDVSAQGQKGFTSSDSYLTGLFPEWTLTDTESSDSPLSVSYAVPIAGLRMKYRRR